MLLNLHAELTAPVGNALVASCVVSPQAGVAVVLGVVAQPEVLQPVVELIAIDVVDVLALRDGAIGLFPHIAMGCSNTYR